MERIEPTAEDSLAAIFDRSKFGMAMAAMIKMIATTISNSIREKPFCLLRIVVSILLKILLPEHGLRMSRPDAILRVSSPPT
jgi:hypothetical protein